VAYNPNSYSTGPAGSSGGLGALLRALKARWWLFLLIALAVVGGAVLAWRDRSSTYEATSEVQVSPVAQDDEIFIGLDLLRDSGDPALTAQTTARLLRSAAAADVAATRMGANWDRQRVLAAVTVVPQQQSNLLLITAEAGSAAEAEKLVGEFSRASLAARRKVIQSQVRAALKRSRERLRRLSDPNSSLGTLISNRITQLEAVRDSGDDPTLTLLPLESSAERVGIPPWGIIAVAVVCGLVLGLAVAVASDLLDRRVRDEGELRRLHLAPVLVRVPRVRRWLKRRRPLAPLKMPPAAQESLRLLAAQLEDKNEESTTIMVAAPGREDGASTIAAGLSVALADAGHRVVLIDFDIGNPELGSALGVPNAPGLLTAMHGSAELYELLLEVPGVPGLRVLTCEPGDAELLTGFAKAVPDIVSDASALAEYVVLDAGPLADVSEGLRLAAEVDKRVLVTRIRHTKREKLQLAADLLERALTPPVGFVLIGGRPAGRRSDARRWRFDESTAVRTEAR
jgi:Mrp family chromosome partitioning ATPase/capsular polysaccharide biosynthesis protein